MNQSFLVNYLKKLSLPLVFFLLLLAGAVILFTYIVDEILLEKEHEFDNAVMAFVSSHFVTDRLTLWMEMITYAASSTFLRIGYGLIVMVCLLRKKFKRAIEIAVIGVGGYLITFVMKLSFERERPADPLVEPLENFSFPSGHATSGFIFYGLLAYLLWKANIPKVYRVTGGVLLIMFSLLIGFSRVYLRVHYPSDVLAGFCVGFTWLFMTIFVFNRMRNNRTSNTTKSILSS